MTKKAVLELCEKVCPGYDIDPVFLLAICEQESHYNETEVRMENGFYRRYSRPMNFPPSTEVLFSASYGLTQIMGLVLYELGYFTRAGDEGSVAALIDRYIYTPELQVDYACRKLKQLKTRNASVFKILLYYNGGATYPHEVWERYERLCKEFDRNPLDAPV